MPGFGHSAPLAETPTPAALAARLATLLDELEIETAHVVGNSLGGWVALELALAGRARSATALCPAGMWRVPPAENDPEPTDRTQRVARRLRPLIPLAMRARPIRHAALSTFVFHPDRVPLAAARRMAVASPARTPAISTIGNPVMSGSFSLSCLKDRAYLACGFRTIDTGTAAPWHDCTGRKGH